MIVILHITHLLDHDLLHLVAELIGLLSAALLWPISTDKPLLHVTLSGSSAPRQRELDKSLLMGNSCLKTPVVGPSMMPEFLVLSVFLSSSSPSQQRMSPREEAGWNRNSRSIFFSKSDNDSYLGLARYLAMYPTICSYESLVSL